MADAEIDDWDAPFDDNYHLEVANTGFGDMLHDHERNQKYFAAIRKTIAQMHAAGKEVHVLDIGTGTGLLAMMAVEAGADSVTACEAFKPMADCAERVFVSNAMEDDVHLIKKRSTEICVGIGSQKLSQRANLLVAELLDTELIGEGAIAIYNHAHENLLTDDVICIPARAKCFAQVAQSPLAANWNSLKALPNLDGELLLKPPDEILQCKSEATLHDVQLSQLPIHHFHPITEAVQTFEFDFSRKQSLELERRLDVQMSTICPGSTDFVFYWWDIDLDAEGEINLSCAPFWTHPDFKSKHENVTKKISSGIPLPNCIPWRDHWMQAIYYIPKSLHLTETNTKFTLSCNHDEFSLWFDVFRESVAPPKTVPRHSCSCHLHMTYARSRIGQLNQSQRNKLYLRHLEEAINLKGTNVLTLGDGCVLGLSSAKLGAAKIVSYEPHRFSRQFMKTLAEANSINNVEFIDNLEDLNEAQLSSFTHVIAEPYFINSILPWDNLYFLTLLSGLREKLSPNIQITPSAARIMAVPVEFLDLHLIRAPIKSCEGFDLSLFDEMIEESVKVVQPKIEAQPLWEYPCKALAEQQEILTINFNNFDDKQTEGEIKFQMNGSCNGIALWINWHLNSINDMKSVVSTGPSEPFAPGDYIKWDMFVRQGVQLMAKTKIVKPLTSKVQWTCKFSPKNGELQMEFDIIE